MMHFFRQTIRQFRNDLVIMKQRHKAFWTIFKFHIRKSQITDEDNTVLEEPVIIAEEAFEEIEDVTAEDMSEKESNEWNLLYRE